MTHGVGSEDRRRPTTSRRRECSGRTGARRSKIKKTGSPKPTACSNLSRLGNHDTDGGPVTRYRPNSCTATATMQAATSSRPGQRRDRAVADSGRAGHHLRARLRCRSAALRAAGGPAYGVGDRVVHVGVEHARHDVGRVELVVGDHRRQRPRGGQQHRRGDLGRAGVQQPAEDAREGQHVVDLVREVRAAGRDDRGVLGASAGSISGSGLASAKTIERSAIVATSSPSSTSRRGDADEDVGADDGLLQRAGDVELRWCSRPARPARRSGPPGPGAPRRRCRPRRRAAAPAASSSLMIAVPAAPAPDITILTSAMSLSTTRSAL